MGQQSQPHYLQVRVINARYYNFRRLLFVFKSLNPTRLWNFLLSEQSEIPELQDYRNVLPKRSC